jgi:Sec-independent protein translocase protein TatA
MNVFGVGLPEMAVIGAVALLVLVPRDCLSSVKPSAKP